MAENWWRDFRLLRLLQWLDISNLGMARLLGVDEKRVAAAARGKEQPPPAVEAFWLVLEREMDGEPSDASVTIPRDLRTRWLPARRGEVLDATYEQLRDPHSQERGSEGGAAGGDRGGGGGRAR